MAKITWKPGTLLAPVPPALISCGTVEKPNVMTAAWTGIISSDPVITYVSVRPSRFSHGIIKESGEFVINLPTVALVTAVDYCGVKSGKDVDKFKEMKLTPGASSQITAPQIMESPISLECKVKNVTNYGTHDMFLAEVVAVNVDDKYINANGKLCLEKAGLLAFAHAHYYTLGKCLGNFGFSVNKARLKKLKNAASDKKVKTAATKASLKTPSKPKTKRKPFKTGKASR